MIDNVRDYAIFMLDTSGHVLTWNLGGFCIYGYARGEIIGQHFSKFYTEEDRKAGKPENELVTAVQEGKSENESFQVRKDGAKFWINSIITSSKDKDGRLTGFTAIIRDITERRKLEDERMRQTKELELYQRATLNILEDIKEAQNQLEVSSKELSRSNKELEQFAYVASHDLQEPIRKIVGFIQLFAKRFDGKLDKDAEEDMNFIIDGAKRMQALVRDLLQFSRLGRAELTLEASDFNDILKEAADNLEIAIKENQAKIHSDGLPTLAVHKSQIVQLFQNLIGNAIKYKSKKPPEIFITAQMKDSEWEFSFQDNGIGIDPQFFGRLFIIFQRLHAKDEYPGTGIGLALCKKIVERHGGRIWLESEIGKGSVFKFTLPVTQN